MAYSSDDNTIPTWKEWAKMGDELRFNNKMEYIIDLNSVTTIEIITEENKKKVAGTMAGGAAGLLLLGPLGAIGGLLLGGNKKLVNIAVSLNDGRYFVATCTTKTHLALLKYAGKGGSTIPPPQQISPSQESTTADDSKECPMCAETIKKKAKICRFCGHTFEDNQESVINTDVAPAENDEIVVLEKDKNNRDFVASNDNVDAKSIYNELEELYSDYGNENFHCDMLVKEYCEGHLEGIIAEGNYHNNKDCLDMFCSFHMSSGIWEHFEEKGYEFKEPAQLLYMLREAEGIDDISALTVEELSSKISESISNLSSLSEDQVSLIIEKSIIMHVKQAFYMSVSVTRDEAVVSRNSTFDEMGIKKSFFGGYKVSELGESVALYCGGLMTEKGNILISRIIKKLAGESIFDGRSTVGDVAELVMKYKVKDLKLK